MPEVAGDAALLADPTDQASIAAALLGNPKTLILDEPINGLDPEGVKWVRTMARHIASSHGPSGANRDYLLDLAAALRDLNEEDPYVFALEAALLDLERGQA